MAMDDNLQPMPRSRAECPDGEFLAPRRDSPSIVPAQPPPRLPDGMPSTRFEPPVSALGPLFRYRLERIHACRVESASSTSTPGPPGACSGATTGRDDWSESTPTTATKAGGRWKSFSSTFLHEVAHHLEYTEPQTFGSRGCRRTHGLMHSRLFWRILGELKWRWAELEARQRQPLEHRSVQPRGLTSIRAESPDSLTLAATSGPGVRRP